MKNPAYKLIGAFAMIFVVNLATAKENIDSKSTKRLENTNKTLSADCDPTTTQTDLDIGNVRTTILVGGDMWWDLKSARYEVPKVTNPSDKRYSLYAGSLWIGGIDQGGQLRVAAQTYRQNGNDFWAGPVDLDSISIHKSDCQYYDKHFKINKSDVQLFVSKGIRNSVIDAWPGNGRMAQHEDHYLAPFQDVNGDGLYNPHDGDYPKFNLSNTPSCDKTLLKGDQAIWWVFNDVGNIHGETNGLPIGLEIQAQAFAFTTSADDPIGSCTFYQYKIINRGTRRIDSTYFGQWVDSDLGYAFDDYVGCDVNRGFGYCYNGDQNDEGPTGYGLNPPAVGVDFFEGPGANVGDGKDNDRDGCIDCTFKDSSGVIIRVPDVLLKEQIIMSKFVYYNNDFTQQGNPTTAQHYYNYLNGIWKDNVRFTYGGNGKGGGTGGTTGQANWCNYMFPGDSDPSGYGEVNKPNGTAPIRPLWTEVTAGNVPADRRFIQSAGPFRLEPGGVNYITTGVVWARASTGGPSASVAALRAIDDDAQALFKSCFNIINGPDAPTASIRELDKEIIISISNDSTSNNYKERYFETDPYTKLFSRYVFQGYQIFQLKNEAAAAALYNGTTHALNEDKVRLVAQCDIEDDIFKPTSYYRDPNYNTWVPANLITEGAVTPYNVVNKGIVHTFRITKDLFANDLNITNNKKLYYYIVAYGVNKSTEEITPDPYNPSNPTSHYKPYISSRRGPGGTGAVPVYIVVPHIPTAENGGTVINTQYGGSTAITRLTGQGNGGNNVDFTANGLNRILSGNNDSVEYAPGLSPISVKVYDPVKVSKADFKLTFLGNTVTDSTKWVLTNSLNAGVDTSEAFISSGNEDIIKKKWGFSVSIKKVVPPGADKNNIANMNGSNGASVTFLPDTANVWFRNVADFDSIRTKAYPQVPQYFNGYTVSDWIANPEDATVVAVDPLGFFNKVAPNYTFSDITGISAKKATGGTWAPFIFAKTDSTSPNSVAVNNKISALFKQGNFQNLPSVLLVITRDTSKWTRSAVVEESTGSTVPKLGLKTIPSINKNGSPDNSGTTGMGWFPGYAINLETGERLNIIYGEDSNNPNGKDLMWNPTSSSIGTAGQQPSFGAYREFGGKHYIYVIGHNFATGGAPAYDRGEYIRTQLMINTVDARASVFKDASWCGMPVLSPGKSMNDGVPLSEVYIRLLVKKPYQNTKYVGDPVIANPSYIFSTKSIAAETNVASVAKKSLDLIKIVPNPYYAASDYESSQFDNRIKITNLPNICTISIYTANGTLVRTLTKDTKNSIYNNGVTSEGIISTDRYTAYDNAVEWDLKNSVGVPIASGPYIFHIKADGIGEKVVKWFGVLRPLDLSNY